MTLIRFMQILGAVSLVLCTLCMALLFLNFKKTAELFFLGAVLCMAASLITLIVEIRISMHALDILLEDMTVEK